GKVAKGKAVAKKVAGVKEKAKKKEENIIDTYSFQSGKIPITINIRRVKEEFVPIYDVSIAAISRDTEFVLEKIREELIEQVNLGIVDIINIKEKNLIEDKFKEAIILLIKKYFPEVDEQTSEFLITFLVQRSLGLGSIEILMSDPNLEEIAINSAKEPVWVYHRKHGWIKTNITIKSEEQTKHYASMIGRKVGRQITILEPLLDANMINGNRVNATLHPISIDGNTITLRKFAAKPWTITDFLTTSTMSVDIAALIWLCIQYEMSILVAGGTASGKTSMLNVVSNFCPPNQRILTIEDTRELRLPRFLHVLPMITRLPNPEGKGEVSMLDLLVNALRQRPDRIFVGEIRRKREAEVLFEAIHTGHAVYATVHANSAKETITRMTNPPIEVPKTMVQAISLVIVQYRNRRTGARKTFQIAEVLEGAETNVIYQYDPKKDSFFKPNKPKLIFKDLEMHTGMTQKQFNIILAEMTRVLNYLMKHNINTVDGVGKIIAMYYTSKKELMDIIRKNKLPEGIGD
ncbi:MAG: CpaF family protein, partial [Nanoarchaeota archaeon]|nr:CpaF family protein [Nanoarchaeota archaeon]